MAKGKKKGGTKKEGDEKKEAGDVPSVSGLSISEDTPSTSQATEEDEDGLGVGLSSAVRRKLKKQKLLEAKAASAAIVKETPETKPQEKLEEKPEEKPGEKPEKIPEEKPEAKPEEKQEVKQEDDSGGLGLSGGAKKRPKKKKSAAAAEAAAVKPVQSAEVLQHIPEQLGQPRQGPPPGVQPGPAGYPPVGAGPPQWGSTGLAQPAAPGFAQPAPASSQPRHAQSTGAGFGRGGPWQAATRPAHPPQHMQFQPPVPSTASSSSHMPPPASASKEVVPLAPSRQQLNCRFRIPAKIIGRSVRHIPTKVITNYLPMEFKCIKVYRYDVTVKPDKPKKMLPQVFKIAKEAKFKEELIAFDQVKNCYSLKPLKNVPLDGTSRFAIPVNIKDPNGKNMEFEVSFKATGVVDFSKIKQHMDSGGSTLNVPSEEIQCIDVILRQGALEAYVKSGRQFFKRPAQPINLSGGLEMWTGLFQSAIFTSRAYINIDVAHKGFPIQQNLVHALTEHFRLKVDRPVEDQWGRDSEYFQAFVKNLRVIATLVGPPNNGQKREFISNLLVQPPGKLKFTSEKDGKKVTMTVAEYFLKVKGYRIKYPNLNCVWVGPRERYIYYPMELLDVAYGQVLNRQLNELQLTNMVREAATPPIERKRKIEEVAASMNYSSNTFFKKFGLEISNKFLEVDAKILQPPSLDTGERVPIIPRRGAWQSNRLVKPEALLSWGFVALDCNVQGCNYENLKDLLTTCGSQMGMQVAEPKMTHFNVKFTELRSILLTATENNVLFIFVIVGTRGRPETYHRVKQMAEKDVGVLTQCIKEYTASRRMNHQTMKNILLKVNSKLMGVNHTWDAKLLPNCIKGGDVMIVGADVTHPSPEQTTIPSIAAVTASLDPRCVIYNIELSIQTPKKEVIVEFEDMMHDHLLLYRQRNQNALPKKIYVFRDGVSEGQFAEVMNSELVAIHKAYQRFNTNTKPEVLFLLVQKRHHTRFFTSPNCGNVEPGTVVDTHIVHPKEMDFYLVSHQAIKGTARPTRYHAVCNDGNIPHDEVEQLTFFLCHLYVRCMRSVSYPTPTYYAHLACLRARSLTYGQTFDNAALDKKPERLRVLEKMLKFSRMFFI